MTSHIWYGAVVANDTKLTARKILAANLRTFIECVGGSQPDLARVTGVPQKTISRALNDENAANLDTLTTLADGLGVEVWELLVPDYDPSTPPVLITDIEEERQTDPDVDRRNQRRLFRILRNMSKQGRKVNIKYMDDPGGAKPKRRRPAVQLSLADPPPDASLVDKGRKPKKRTRTPPSE